jgi:hypothetical protein
MYFMVGKEEVGLLTTKGPHPGIVCTRITVVHYTTDPIASEDAGEEAITPTNGGVKAYLT